MSKEYARTTQIIPTALGNLTVTNILIEEYDVEDLTSANSESQARSVQMQNVGSLLQDQPSWPKDILPTSFQVEEDV